MRVPIRAIHYQEILCLFRKGHGPILQVKKLDEEEKKKKATLVKAKDTVQGFIKFEQFCKDLVSMLGDAVLLVKPKVFSLIIQLVFEAVSVSYKDQYDEDSICLRRITDIVSPFENQVTDNIPVHKIFRTTTLDMIVKFHCMQRRNTAETKRLVKRRFVPQTLHSGQGQEQLFDNIGKVMQH